MSQELPNQERFSEPFRSPEKPPEGLDLELLVILMEEMAEATQRASKAIRFGVREVQAGQLYDNARRLSMELGDVIGVMKVLQDHGVLDAQEIDAAAADKLVRLQKWLQNTE